MTPLPLVLYRLATGALEPLAPALLAARARRGKADAARIGERLGRASVARPDGPLAWLHGASVGESLSLLPLIEGLRARRPDLSILVTSGTVTSAEMMAKRLPEGAIHQYAPIDAPRAAERFLDRWRPDLAVFVESELWPNLILGAKARGARLALLSARLSDRSLKGWARAPASARAVFGAFDLAMAQDGATAEALVRLGARDDGRLNLKRLGAPPPVDEAALAALKAEAEKPVLLAASTHPGEDEMVLQAFRLHQGAASLVIVPRHPARAGDIQTLAAAEGFQARLRSRGEPFGGTDVYIADTLGELGLWFALARGALIGGGLVPGPGGHNPIEAAQLGCPILTGPHVDNWRAVYADLMAADAAVTVRSAEALAAAFARLLADHEAARAQADRARHVVAIDRAALNLAVEALISLAP